MAKQFSGRVALVTGGDSGIGKATSLAFAREGATVVIANRHADTGQRVVDEIKGIGGEALAVETDVSKPEQTEALVNKIVETYGGLDFAFNNAGIEGVPAPTAEYPVNMWNNVISINLSGVFYCLKYEIAQMVKQKKGVVINNASILGKVGFATASAYVAAKHGVLGLTETAAIEYATKGIRVNAVCPGFIATPMLERGGIFKDASTKQYIENLHPAKRLGTTDEIANAVIWLCSDGASFVTGHSLLVDGGYTAQ